MAEAFHIAEHRRPGPVLVDITKDALQARYGLRLAAAARSARLPPGHQAAREADPRGRAADRGVRGGPCSTSEAGWSRPAAWRGAEGAGRAARHASRDHADGPRRPTRTVNRGISACRACTAPRGGRRAAGQRPADRAGHPVRRPGDRSAVDVRAAGPGSSTPTSTQPRSRRTVQADVPIVGDCREVIRELTGAVAGGAVPS